VVCRSEMLGEMRVWPSGITTFTGSMLERTFFKFTAEQVTDFKTHVYGSAQYSENIVDMMLTTTSSFVWSVAVTSMKIFRVFSVILLCSELMIGGMDSTRSSAS
jgi:hypothetical protein